jgi:hypothetical protein
MLLVSAGVLLLDTVEGRITQKVPLGTVKAPRLLNAQLAAAGRARRHVAPTRLDSEHSFVDLSNPK